MFGSKMNLLSGIALLPFLILITGKTAIGSSLDSDKQVLLNLKSYLDEQNGVNLGVYSKWDADELSPCNWPGIWCSGGRVRRIDLSSKAITGSMFRNFSALSELNYLDLSQNTISGTIPADLSRCQNLRFLNLSHNIITGEHNLTGLNKLEVLDLSVNRISSDLQSSLSGICSSLVVANLSQNSFVGEIGTSLDECRDLQYVDLSFNELRGDLLLEIGRLREFAASGSTLGGKISPSLFTQNCSLQVLDISDNSFGGEFPKEISNCKDLMILNLGKNNFVGKVPQELGSILSLQELLFSGNNFSREIPESLLDLRNLAFLDLSANSFGGDVQDIFGRFMQLKVLVLLDNLYTGGIDSSGIFYLPNVSWLDLSYNSFSGPLPVGISQMVSLKYLILSYNQFTGNIRPEFGNLSGLQTLDLSFNRLSGQIPPSLGKLTSLLWLILGNNLLTGEIPSELGTCNSLLWLNLANNQLSGNIPPALANIGNNPMSTFQLNRQSEDITFGLGDCLSMRRWIPMDYHPFSFVYTRLATGKSCNNLINLLLTGHGMFPFCVPGSNIRTYQISGYLQLSGNELSGELPPELGSMKNFSILQLGANRLNGTIPREIGLMPLVVLNISRNMFSGDIPGELGQMKCMQNLDLSYNNFSGSFPNLNNLTELSKLNVSYNPYISGFIPATGQLATFDIWSFLGDPLLRLPSFIRNDSTPFPNNDREHKESAKGGLKPSAFPLSFAISFLFFFVLSSWIAVYSGISERLLQKIVGIGIFHKRKVM